MQEQVAQTRGDGREDHIVPINGAYGSVKHLPGKKRFVMGASGHNAAHEILARFESATLRP